MSEPQSPFDESDDEPLDEVALQPVRKPLERKWSFVGLGIALFILVWIREFTRMSPTASIAAALSILLAWIVVHLLVFTRVSQVLLEFIEDGGYTQGAAEHGTARSAAEYDRTARRWRGLAIRLAAILGLVIGIWIPFLVPLSAIVLTVLVLVVFSIAFLVEWLVRHLA